MLCLPISAQEARFIGAVAALLCSREAMLTLLKIRSNLAKFSLQVRTLQGQSQKHSLQRKKISPARSNSRSRPASEERA